MQTRKWMLLSIALLFILISFMITGCGAMFSYMEELEGKFIRQKIKEIEEDESLREKFREIEDETLKQELKQIEIEYNS